MEDLSREHLIKWLRETMGEHVDFGEPMRQSFKLASDTIERQAKEISGLQKDNDAGRELMRQAWHVFNGIRAADGAPYGYTHEWWDEITEALQGLLGGDTTPWMTGAAKALIDPLIKELQDEQYTRIKAEQERDAALAEVERLKANPSLSGWFYCQACGERNDVEPKGGLFSRRMSDV